MKDIFRHLIRHNITYESSPVLSNYSPLNLFGVGRFETEGKNPNEYVAFCINDAYIIPKAYRIKAVNSPQYNSHMKSWLFHGASQNSSEWTQLDNKTDNSDVRGLGKEKTFPINNAGAFKCFKITIICSHNPSLPYRLTLYDFDINGMLLVKNCSCKNARSRFNILITTIIFMSKAAYRNI